jgi:hypothetical protein
MKVAQKIKQQFLPHSQFILLQFQVCLTATSSFVYLNIFCRHSFLNVWSYATEMRQPVCLRGKHNRSLKVAVQGLVFMAQPLYIHAFAVPFCRSLFFRMISSLPSNFFPLISFFKGPKNGSRKEPGPSCRLLGCCAV